MKHLAASLTLLVLLGAPRAVAWNGTGHMIVARIAWEKLDPDHRTKLVAVLKGAPAISQELQAAIPAGASGDPDMQLFVQAATWPDMVRSPSSPNHNESHPRWHFIDEPVVAEGFEARPDQGLSTTFDPQRGGDPENAVQALIKNEYDLANAAAPFDKARALCWILHLTGDLHQPLHCASLFDTRFPHGDKGGNAIKTRGGGAPELHAIWDNILGRNQAFSFVTSQAKSFLHSLESDVSEQAREDRIVEWVNESERLAQDVAYDGGRIDDELDDSGKTSVFVVTTDYLKSARAVAQKQVVIAGIRLVSVLSK